MGDALTVGSLFVAMTFAAIGPSAPMPAPTDAPLKEIGHVRATTELCRALLPEAIDAVAVEIANDRRLDDVYRALRTLDFDSNPMVKYRSTRAMDDRYVALRAASVSGIGTLKQFRDGALAATNDAQRKSLTDFADLLSGAIYRQKVLADDIGKFVAYLDAHDSIDNDTQDRMTFDAILSQNVLIGSATGGGTTPGSAYVNDTTLGAATAADFGTPHAAPVRGATTGLENVLDTVPMPLSTVAKDGATELAKRALPIAVDERTASALIEPAFSGC